MELENTAVETVEAETDLEVAEPDESPEDGRNYQEVAEPESEEEVAEQSHEDNAKFQEFRHQREEAEARAKEAEAKAEELQRELDEIKAQQSVKEEVYSQYLDDESIDSIIADALGLTDEQYNAELEHREYVKNLEAKVAQYEAKAEEALQREQVARENEALTNQLAEVNKLDPSITNVLDFEEKFAGLSHTPSDYLEKGLTLTETYWALKAELDAHKRTPPPEAGGVKNEPTEKPFYTKDDVLAMTPEERTKHWKEIRESQQKW